MGAVMDRRNSPFNPVRIATTDRVPQLIKQALGYLFALVCLIWVFHDFRFGELMQTITKVRWEWVGLAVTFDILSYISQGIRWRLLLKTRGDISTLRATQAIYAALFTNEMLPLRIGELVRAYLVSSWLSCEFVSVIPSMAVERLFDSVWLALAVGLVAFLVPLPKDLLESEEVLGTIVLIGVGLLLYLVLREEKTVSDKHSGGATAWKPIGFLKSFINRLAFELKGIGFSRFFYTSFVASFFVLFFQVLSFWLVMVAYDLNLPFLTGAVVFLIVHLGTAIPNAPANVGTYQFFCVLGLSLFGVEKTPATAFSVVVFVILTVPLWAIGFFALSRTGMSLSTVRNEINRLLQTVRTGRK